MSPVEIQVEVPWQPRKCLHCNIYGRSDLKYFAKLSPSKEKDSVVWRPISLQKATLINNNPCAQVSCNQTEQLSLVVVRMLNLLKKVIDVKAAICSLQKQTFVVLFC